MSFTVMKDVTGAGIARTLLKQLKSNDQDTFYLIG